MKLFRAFYAGSERHSQEELLNCMKFRAFQGRPEEIIKNMNEQPCLFQYDVL